MDRRIRGFFSKLYKTIFVICLFVGIIGSLEVAWIYFTACSQRKGPVPAAGEQDWSFMTNEELLAIARGKSLTDAQMKQIERHEMDRKACDGALDTLGSAWAALIVLLFTKKLLYEKWFLWLISDWLPPTSNPST
jgi:hypothetical protein